MATSFELTALFEHVENGWVQARILEIPGVITAAPSADEAKEMLGDALREYLLALGDLEQPAPVNTEADRFRVGITIGL